MSRPYYNQQGHPPQLQPGSAQSPYPTSPPPQQYQSYNPPSVPPNKPVPSPSHSPYPPSYSPAPQGYPQAPYSAHPPTQGYSQAPPYGQSQQGYARAPPPPPQAQPYGAPYPPQQQSYGQPYPPQGAPYPGGAVRPPGPQGPAGPGGARPARATEHQIAAYKQLLIGTIQENNLQYFYPPDKLDRLVQTLANDAPAKIERLTREWSVPQEVAQDVMKLSLYDVILYVDDSGSMEFEERGLRKEQLKQIVGIVATAASTFDQDGISVRFMNSMESSDGVRNVEDVNRLVARVRFSGLTPLGTGLRNKVLDPMVLGPARAGRLQKPILVIIITDGQPAGEPLDTVANSIRYATDELSRTQLGRGAIAFEFTQVGTDTKARDFLASLDEDSSIGRLIDCTSNFEVEQDEMSRAVPPVYLTRELWCAKLMLGAIDQSYDTQDEKAAGRAGGAVGAAPPGQYGGYNQAQNYSQPGYHNQPPAPSYNQPGSYGQPQGYNQPPYPPSQGGPSQPGYGQQYGGYGAPSPQSDPYGRPPSGPAPPSGYPPQQGSYPPPPRRY